jgi:hypothetical protein
VIVPRSPVLRILITLVLLNVLFTVVIGFTVLTTLGLPARQPGVSV